MKITATIVAAIAMLGTWSMGSLAHGAVLFDNGVPSPSNYAQTSDLSLPDPGVVGDNFTLSSPVLLSGVEWSGFFSVLPLPTEDDVTIRIFDYSGDFPSPPALHVFALGNNVTRTDSGIDMGNSDLFNYTATVPETFLPAGRYMISIGNDTNTGHFTQKWSWRGATAVGPLFFRSSDGSAFQFSRASANFDFTLTGAVVPEPQSATLAAGCFAAVSAIAQRRRLLR